MEFGFEELNNLTHNSDYYIPCTLNGLVTSLHKYRFTMYINGFTAISAFSSAGEFNSWRNKPVVIKDGRELKLPQISLEFNDCDLSFKNLSGYNFSTARFKNVNLHGAVLINSNLSGAVFEEVVFNEANLTGAVFSRYNQFINCALIDTNFRDTAMADLLREAYTTASRYTKTHFTISKCELLPGMELTLPRYPQKRMDLEAQIDKIAAVLRAVDEKGIFTVAVQGLAYEQSFNITDPYSKFFEELQKKYPTWGDLGKVEELLAEISAVLVLEKLSF
ncbi:pentapeptide repeat-containing protein [Desulfolucanica intricata]|uniref:pentapeptide repeat-containing protein n=1 Tax=Desulfolucanica intricata TaxID=1285191 RepID=UPI0008309C74|nr:pentapeptide repeat-containing protein [Desulfolucanica intricata]